MGRPTMDRTTRRRRRRRPRPGGAGAPSAFASLFLLLPAIPSSGFGFGVGGVVGVVAAFSPPGLGPPPRPLNRRRPFASATTSTAAPGRTRPLRLESGAGDDDSDVVVLASSSVASPSSVASSSSDDAPPSTSPPSSPPASGAPPWMRCVNAPVPPNVRALNEAVSLLANVTLCQANELVETGAVWARMENLDEDDVLDQYYGGGGAGSSAALRYADLPSGWGSGSENDELNNSNGDGEGGEGEGETLDEYVARIESLRYRRILSPSTIDPGTDLRIYPRPRRFPACYDFADPSRLLYEDTTFLVVDKPPMLPTQPEPSNYLECCPGCVDLLMGPFRTIEGEEVRRPLICHRVDSVVGGCVVLSKDGNGQKVFSELQRQRKIKKLYLTVTTEPVPLGMHVHWTWKSLNRRGQSGGTPCQFVSHVPPASRKKAKVRGSVRRAIGGVARPFGSTNRPLRECLREPSTPF
ncbi:hypothetical protein ACHAWF_005259 [Thalassiosira exigua]